MKKYLLLTLLLSVTAGITNAQTFPNDGWVTKTAITNTGRWAEGLTSDLTDLYEAAGADASFNYSQLTQKFATGTNTWSNLATFPTTRYQVHATLYNGKVYVIGGYSFGFSPTNAVNIYDIAGNTWSTGANMPTAVGDYATVLNGDRIYIMCGYSGASDQTLVQVYNITANSWSTATAFPGMAVAGCRAGIVNNTIVFVGGYNQTFGSQSQAYKGVIDASNPLLITWTALPNYPGGTVARHCAGSLDIPSASRVYFTAGDPNGQGTSALTATYAYNVAASQWESGPNKPTGVNNVMGFAPLVVNDSLYFACVAGYNGSSVTSVNEWLRIGLAHAPMAIITGNDSICTNSSTTLTATATGISQKWQVSTNNVNFTDIPSATTNTYTTPNITQVTYYRYITYAMLDSAISATFTVVPVDPVSITTQPTDASACHGAPVIFEVQVSGVNPSYQWYENNVAVQNTGVYSGANSSILAISNSTGLTGNSYKVLISNACNAVTSDIVSLTETPTDIWNGSVSTDWSNPDNWGCGIPTIYTDAEIPDGVPNMPLVDIPDAVCKSIVIHTGASLGGTGIGNALEIRTTITTDGLFDPSLCKITFSGPLTQYMPAVTYKHLETRGGSTKIMLGDITVTDSLQLTLGSIRLDKHNFTLVSPALTSGAGDTCMLVTNDSGRVIIPSLGIGGNTGAATVPIGRDGRSFTPITLQNSGAMDTFSIRVEYDVYDDGYGLGFNPPTAQGPVVDRTWIVSEYTPGGSNINMTLQWRDTNTVNNFNTSHVYVGQFMNGQWFSLNGPSATAPPAGGSNPYYTTANNIQSLTLFTAASSGPYPLASRVMNSTVFNINAYPNPAMSYITLNIDGSIAGKAKINVTDVTGRLIKTTELTGSKAIVDISDLSSGMYFIKYVDDAHQELIKFNKQ